MITVSLVRILIILVNGSTVLSLLCLSCKNVRYVQDCLTVEECGAHQKCYSNRVTDSHGTHTYSLGCVDQFACVHQSQSAVGKRETNVIQSGLTFLNADQKRRGLTSCLQCCNNANGCNLNLCATAKVTTSLRCMTCRDALETNHCNKAIECGRDQFCFIQRALDPIIGDRRYKMDCMGYQQCDALKTTIPQDCATCCNNTDYCNYAACDNWSSTHRKTTPTSVKTTNTPRLTTSTPPVTSTTPPLTVSTPPPNIHILVSGPHISSYGSHVEIKFIIMPLPQSYVWKFNGTNALPKGVSIQDSEGSLAGMATIVIAELNETTSGTYSCIPTVNGRQVKKTHFIGIQQERPTVYISKPTVTTSFVLVCNVTGYPLPIIQWDFVPSGIGSHGIPPGVQFSTEKLKSALYVGAYNPAYHNGVWYCRASNALGSAVTSVHIH